MSQNATTLKPTSIKLTAFLCWLGWVFDFYDLILIAFLIHSIEISLHIGTNAGAWLIGVGLGASGLGGILSGWLADLYGRKRILSYTVILFSVGMFATAFAQNTLQFLIARFVTGLGLGGEWAVGHALIAESVPQESRARWSAFLQSGEPVGVALASIIGFMVAPHIGWRLVFILSSLTGGLAWVFRRYIKESPIWQQSPVQTLNQRIADLKPFIKDYWGLVILAFILAVLKLGTYWTCYTWLPRFIQGSFGVALGESALWFLCGQVGQFIGMYIFGFIADQVGRRWGFTIFSLITATALLPLALFWHTLFHHEQTLFWGLMFFLGFGSGCTAGFGALLAEIFPTQQRTFAMGTVYNLARGVQVFSPVIVAMAVQHSGLQGGLLVPTSLAVLTAMWVWTLPDRNGQALTAS